MTILLVLLAALALLGALLFLFRRALRAWARRTMLRFHPRVDRYKLEERERTKAELEADPAIDQAARRHATETGISVEQAKALVDAYIDEIVPAFNVLSYYQIGYKAASLITRFFYRVTVEHRGTAPLSRLPREDVVVYLMNHRSNIDYVVVTYVLARVVSISYAVGEWARTWPLEHVFKSFGSYFVRRRYPEPLYHAVLERYVQLITRHRVTQGIFPEGGLTRDGALRRPKLGLLDAIVRTVGDPGFDGDVWLVPVGINYDWVLEDRTLTRELVVGAPRRSRLAQLGGWIGFGLTNIGRFIVRRSERYGRVAVTFGSPISVRRWLAGAPAGILDRPRAERLPVIGQLAGSVMEQIGLVIPVTPVTLAAAALLSFPRTVIPRRELLDRLRELVDRLPPSNTTIVRSELTVEQVWGLAWRTFRLRRWVVRDRDALVVLPNARPLLHYYANAIRHLVPEEPGWELSPAEGEDLTLPKLARER